MSPELILGLLGNFAFLLPPPWGLIAGAAVKVIPLIAEGRTAWAAVNEAAPDLVPHIRALATEIFGGDHHLAANVLFGAHQMTPEEAEIFRLGRFGEDDERFPRPV